jgi:hypothetical protein
MPNLQQHVMGGTARQENEMLRRLTMLVSQKQKKEETRKRASKKKNIERLREADPGEAGIDSWPAMLHRCIDTTST